MKFEHEEKTAQHVVLFQGSFSSTEKIQVQNSMNGLDRDVQIIFVGESCLSSKGLVYHICNLANSSIDAPRSPFGDVIVVTNGFLPCVHAAFVCGGGYPVLVLPMLLEQHEIGSHVERIGAGVVLHDWRGWSMSDSTQNDSCSVNARDTQ